AEPAARTLYQCGAGLTMFHVDPFGGLRGCLMAGETGYSLRKGSFEEGWRGAVAEARGVLASEGNRCLGCDSRALCGYCPGFFALESGSPERRSGYLCELGRLRREYILNTRAQRHQESDASEASTIP